MQKLGKGDGQEGLLRLTFGQNIAGGGWSPGLGVNPEPSISLMAIYNDFAK